ncbi:MAG: carboxypeptidase-like regulatory domain-containing protein, partial [Chthoniobacter sp.]
MNVSGKLISKNSAPVAGVKVQVLDGQGIISTSPPSAADGTFRCIVTEQWYDRPLTLQINAPGYIPLKHDLKVQDGAGPYEFTFELIQSVPSQPNPPPPPEKPPKGWWPP